MKRILLIALSIILILSLYACGNTQKPEKYCWNCGEGISKVDSFCGHCGVSVKDNHNETVTSNAETSESSTTSEPSESQEPVHTHTYSTEVIEATCTEKGYTTYTCSCGDTYTADETAAKGHSYTDKVTAPTCTNGGYTTHTCACGDTYTDDEIEAKGHSWVSATCTTPKTCTICNDTEGAATGHSWGKWKTVVEAEVGKNGQEKRTCSNCNQSETQTIPALKEDTTKKWFISQFNIAKQQYMNSLNSSISTKQAKIDDLRDDARTLYVNYMNEVQKIKERYAGSAGTLDRALRDAQLNYNNSAQVYTNQINSLESEIDDIKNEIANPNVDNILAIVTKDCNISSKETYEHYYKYSDSLD